GIFFGTDSRARQRCAGVFAEARALARAVSGLNADGSARLCRSICGKAVLFREAQNRRPRLCRRFMTATGSHDGWSFAEARALARAVSGLNADGVNVGRYSVDPKAVRSRSARGQRSDGGPCTALAHARASANLLRRLGLPF